MAKRWTVKHPLWSLPGVPTGRSLEDHIQYLSAAVRQQYPEGPVILMGFSSGGLMAWEVASRLETWGRQVEYLILIDSQPLPATLADDHHAVTAIVETATGKNAGAELVERFRQTVKHLAEAPLSVIDTPVMFLKSESLQNAAEDPASFWRQRCTSSVQVIPIPGSHFNCLQPPHVDLWTELLCQTLTSSVHVETEAEL